jgi:hypothetical protein
VCATTAFAEAAKDAAETSLGPAEQKQSNQKGQEPCCGTHEVRVFLLGVFLRIRWFD